VLLTFLLLVFFVSGKVFAQANNQAEPKQEYVKAVVEQIVSQGEKEAFGYKNLFQTLRVKIISGKDSGKYTIVDNGKDTHITSDQEVAVGQELVLTKIVTSGGRVSYVIFDIYRLNPLILLIAVFFILIFLVSGLKGFGSLLGMLFSLAVILKYIIPNLLSGKDPLTITIIGAMIILFVTTYLAHGISKKTTVALISTFIALILTAIFSIAAINFAHITGLGNEDFFTLQFGPTDFINIKGLFLSGIIIGALGALNDITTTQAATIFELKKTNGRLKFSELLQKGFSVGKEHIASLVNTLVLAYAGSSLAIFIFLIINPIHLPYWVILNNEIISDEVIRIIAGSIGLILSVPIVTVIAAGVVSKKIS
jgi:uncharacterized membrane protein